MPLRWMVGCRCCRNSSSSSQSSSSTSSSEGSSQSSPASSRIALPNSSGRAAGGQSLSSSSGSSSSGSSPSSSSQTPITTPCCSEGTVSRRIIAELTSACAAYNGNFEMNWLESEQVWEGFFEITDETFCGHPCIARFVFLCTERDPENEPGVYEWRFADGGDGRHTGCASETCTPEGFRRHATDVCSPLDITLTTGNLVVSTLCACCTGDAITARVYEP